MNGIRLYFAILVCIVFSFGICYSNQCKESENKDVFETTEQCILCTNSTHQDCYEGGDQTELLKYHLYYYQQKVSILPPQTDSCYINILFYQNSFRTSNFDDRLYISKTLPTRTCSQDGKWDAVVYRKSRHYRTYGLKHVQGRLFYATIVLWYFRYRLLLY